MHRDKCCVTELDRLILKFQHFSLSYRQIFFVVFTPTHSSLQTRIIPTNRPVILLVHTQIYGARGREVA